MALKWPPKDPDEILDYTVNWSRYLDGDVINSVTWFCEDENGVKQEFTDAKVVNGLQRISASYSDSSAVLQLGLGTNNTAYQIYCRVNTSSGATTERKINIKVRQRD